MRTEKRPDPQVATHIRRKGPPAGKRERPKTNWDIIQSQEQLALWHLTDLEREIDGTLHFDNDRDRAVEILNTVLKERPSFRGWRKDAPVSTRARRMVIQLLAYIYAEKPESDRQYPFYVSSHAYGAFDGLLSRNDVADVLMAAQKASAPHICKPLVERWIVRERDLPLTKHIFKSPRYAWRMYALQRLDESLKEFYSTASEQNWPALVLQFARSASVQRDPSKKIRDQGMQIRKSIINKRKESVEEAVSRARENALIRFQL